MVDDKEVGWRLFEIHKGSIQSVGRSQGRYVTGLLGFLALLWGWHFMKPEELTIQLLGVTLRASGLWVIAPAVLTILSLGLIGSMNIMGVIWKRFAKVTQALEQEVWWTDIDTHKSLFDYFFFLTPRLERPVEPDKPPKKGRQFDFTVFSYPVLLLGATVTTLHSDYEGSSLVVQVYVYGCAGLQMLFSARIWWQAVCRFLGVRKEQTMF